MQNFHPLMLRIHDQRLHEADSIPALSACLKLTCHMQNLRHFVTPLGTVVVPSHLFQPATTTLGGKHLLPGAPRRMDNLSTSGPAVGPDLVAINAMALDDSKMQFGYN